LVTDDSRMIVANNHSGNVTVFDVDADGWLSPCAQAAIPRPIFIAPVPDGGGSEDAGC
jgi:hypothetical protein